MAKKSLGQHFLTSGSVVESIVKSAKIKKTDTILEIGPGKGILSSQLLKRAGKVIAVEIDDDLIVHLKKKFPKEIESNKLEIINADILTLNLDKMFGENIHFKVVANIPYYITGKILRTLFSIKKLPTSVTILIQDEVAKRIVAQDNKESILSISVKVFGDPKYIEQVPASHFAPKPKVDSAILNIEDISRTFFDEIDENSFFKMIQSGFAHKRKKLSSNLNINDEKLSVCNLLSTARAEEVSIKDWKCVYKIVCKK